MYQHARVNITALDEIVKHQIDINHHKRYCSTHMLSHTNKINSLLFTTMFALAIPTGAILISSQALPGDTFYPVKTSLEKIVGLIFSPSYQAKSDLQIKLIEKRIEENQKLLLSSGSTEGLKILIAQAESSKDYILNSNASQETKKLAVKKLINTLKSSQKALEKEKQALILQADTNSKADQNNIQQTSNPTISQGNSTTQQQTQTTTQSQQEATNNLSSQVIIAANDLNEATTNLSQIIDEVENENGSNQDEESVIAPTPTTTPTPETNSESTPESSTNPNPSLTPRQEQIFELFQENRGRLNEEEDED